MTGFFCVCFSFVCGFTTATLLRCWLDRKD